MILLKFWNKTGKIIKAYLCHTHFCNFMCRVRQQKEIHVPAMDCLPKKVQDFVDGQIALTRAKKHGERYTAGQKNMALRLYHHSPRCYMEMKSIFRLPSTATLSRHLMASLGSFEVESCNIQRFFHVYSYWWPTGRSDHIYWQMQKNRKLKRGSHTTN